MSLFFPHASPLECAVVLDDKRVHSSLVETAHIIRAVIGTKGWRSTYHDGDPYSPPVIWASQSDSNIRWVIDHRLALGIEYKLRTGRVHSTRGTTNDNHVEYAQGSPSPSLFIDEAHSPVRRLDFTGRKDVHTAYRMYLRALWRDCYRPPRWTNRGEPHWLDDSIPDNHHYGVIDKNRLTMRARFLVGFANVGDSGVIDCPRCGSEMTWDCPDNYNYVKIHCEDPDCIHLEE